MLELRHSVGLAVMAVVAIWIAATGGAYASCQHVPATLGQSAGVVSVRAIEGLRMGGLARCAMPCRDCAPERRGGCCAGALLAASDAISVLPRRDRDPPWHGADPRTSQAVAPPYRPPNAPSTT